MKKQYEAPVVNSLRYVFAEGIARDIPSLNAGGYGDLEIDITSLTDPDNG